MQILENKVAIITGASSGIGHATAKLFAQHGAKVVVGARRHLKLEVLVNEIHQDGGQARFLPGDVTNESYCKSLVDLAIREFGQLDIAFNNAGMLGESTAVTDLSLQDWNQILNTNLTSVFLSVKHQIPAMQESGGSVIFTSSFVGHKIGMPNLSAYCSSKAGIIGLVKSLATEYGQNDIRINALLPGGTDTPMAQSFCSTPKISEFVNSIHALKRMATPEEIAHSALYLASDASTFTTGTAMLVDGGASVCKT